MFITSQDLIDFCKDIGLQSSTAATRNSTIKLIGSLHKFVGPGDCCVYSCHMFSQKFVIYFLLFAGL